MPSLWGVHRAALCHKKCSPPLRMAGQTYLWLRARTPLPEGSRQGG